jgi:hypothetical protein
MRANSINDTDIDLINFKSMTKKIKHKTFHPYIPPNIKKISDAPEIDDKSDPKRLKIEGQIKNKDVVAKWKLKNDESWNDLFKSKSKMDQPCHIERTRA